MKKFFNHLPEYLMEAGLLGIFMFMAVTVVAALEHPASGLHGMLPDPFLRRSCIGLAMGLTAVALIYSPWGRRSGAHMNPSITLTFVRLGKVHPLDGVCYVLFQFLGGATGVFIASLLIHQAAAHPSVQYAVTRPGPLGTGVAFAAEMALSFGLMTLVLHSTSNPRLARFTGCFAGLLVAIYIAFEAPLSGMSMNPARTTASSLVSGQWAATWIYFTAPPLGMLAAAEFHRMTRGLHRIACAKLIHDTKVRCIFCGYPGETATSPANRPK